MENQWFIYPSMAMAKHKISYLHSCSVQRPPGTFLLRPQEVAARFSRFGPPIFAMETTYRETSLVDIGNRTNAETILTLVVRVRREKDAIPLGTSFRHMADYKA